MGYIAIEEIECIEEGGTEPTVALLRRLWRYVEAALGWTRLKSPNPELVGW